MQDCLQGIDTPAEVWGLKHGLQPERGPATLSFLSSPAPAASAPLPHLQEALQEGHARLQVLHHKSP